MNEAVQLFDGQLSVIQTPLAKKLSPKEVLVKVRLKGDVLGHEKAHQNRSCLKN